MAKKFFHFYHSYSELFEVLSGDSAKRVMMHVAEYSERGCSSVRLESAEEKILARMMVQQIDRDDEKYDEKCRANRENAMRRWHGDGTKQGKTDENELAGESGRERMRTHANGCERMRSDAKHAKEKEKEKDKENEIKNICSPAGPASVSLSKKPQAKKALGETPELAEAFESLWGEYPRKQGNKKQAMKHFVTAVRDGTSIGAIRDGLQAHNAYHVAKCTDLQFVRYAATWFSQRGWEDDYTIRAPTPPKPAAATRFANFKQRKYDWEYMAMLERVSQALQHGFELTEAEERFRAEHMRDAGKGGGE